MRGWIDPAAFESPALSISSPAYCFTQAGFVFEMQEALESNIKATLHIFVSSGNKRCREQVLKTNKSMNK